MAPKEKIINFKEIISKSKKIFIIGVAGDSGSGKTTFVKGIKDLFGDEMVCTFSLDDYHTYDRGQRAKLKIFPLNPEANDLELLYQHLVLLKQGKPIDKPVYNHKSGKFDKPVKFFPKPIVIIEGLLPFYTEKLRDIIDFKLFVDPTREVKRKWKVKRDVMERGHKLEDVMPEIIAREPDYKRFVDFQKIYAEVVVKIHPTNFVDITGNSDIISIRVIQRLLDIPLPHLNLNIDIGKLLKVSKKNFSLNFEGGDYYGYDVSMITIDGMIQKEIIKELQKKICEFVGGCKENIFKEEYSTATDLAKLLISWRFLEQINYILKKS